MTDRKRQGSFSADIPADAVAEALAAVEKGRAARAAAEPEAPRVEVEPPAAGEATPPGPGEASALGGEAARLRAELELSQERARQVFAQLKDEHDRLLRAAADLENYKKRAARERDEVQRYGNERLLKELLPALDGLERALATAPAGDPLASGVAMTRRLLEDALGRFGAKGFSARGERFDPARHEALMTVERADAAPGTVVDEQHRGWFLHDRLLRPAAVVVAAAARPADAPAAPAGEAPAGAHGTVPERT